MARLLLAIVVPLIVSVAATAHAQIADGELGPPIDCSPGENCFLQQTMDVLSSPSVADVFCGHATYDGHTGADIRLLSVAKISNGVPVVAMADGTVAGIRDGMDDRPVTSEADRAALAGRECGNGVLIDHGGGIVTQYCHMRKGSIVAARGDRVRRGDKIGEVGASGFAQFPHVHAEMRINNQPVDILTGRSAGSACDGPPLVGAPLLTGDFAERLGDGDAVLIASGLAGTVIDHDALTETGPPPPADSASPALVGWVWFANLRAGDRLSLSLSNGDGNVIAANVSEPLERDKADYSAFVGKRGAPAAGKYSLTIEVLRGDAKPVSRRRDFILR